MNIDTKKELWYYQHMFNIDSIESKAVFLLRAQRFIEVERASNRIMDIYVEDHRKYFGGDNYNVFIRDMARLYYLLKHLDKCLHLSIEEFYEQYTDVLSVTIIVTRTELLAVLQEIYDYDSNEWKPLPLVNYLHKRKYNLPCLIDFHSPYVDTSKLKELTDNKVINHLLYGLIKIEHMLFGWTQ